MTASDSNDPASRGAKLGDARERAQTEVAHIPGSEAISAVVVTYRTGPVLQECLERLATVAGVAEIIIVDNGNPPDDEAQIDLFASRNPAARILRGTGNIGFGTACNLGAKAAKCQWLLFVNPDLVVEPNTPRLLRDFAALRDGLTLVGGRVVGVDGIEQRGARRDEISPWSAFVAGAGLGKLERFSPIFRDPHRERDPVPPSPVPTAAVSGALFLIARTAFHSVGGFDQRYFLHVEDIDLCRRVRQRGGEVWFHPGAGGSHVGATSDVSTAEVSEWKERSFSIYFERYSGNPLERYFGRVLAFALRAKRLLQR